MKNHKTTACIVIGLFTLLAQCGSKEQHQTSSPVGQGGISNGPQKMVPVVAVSKAERSTIKSILQLTGSVEPVRIARLASPVEGPVQTLWAREGDTVKAGKLLVDIGRKNAARAQLVAAREYMQKQEQELKRIEKLVGDGAIAGSELDLARSQFENARAQYVRAGEASGDFRILAPWSGIVAKVLVTEGNFVAPRTPLLEMYDPSTIVIIASAPESRSTELRMNAPVEIRLDAFSQRTFTGSISRIYPQLDTKTRTRTFEVTVNDQINLIPGMFARLQIEVARADSALVIEDNAVVTTLKGETVIYVIENKKAVVRTVITGIRHKGRIQIKQGLQAGDMVITAGNEKLKNGLVVRIASVKDSDTGKVSAAGVKTQFSGQKQSAQKGTGK